jgi:DNA-binding LytR/AlgR family response regulator
MKSIMKSALSGTGILGTKVITKRENITVREKISDVSSFLPKEEFLQVHKSFVAAPRHIKTIEGNRILILDHIVPIGKVYRTNIVNLFQ